MSMETELARIASALERIEARMAGSVAPPVMEEPVAAAKPATRKRKGTKAIRTAPAAPEAPVDFGSGDSVANENTAPFMSAETFLKECNAQLVAIKDFTRRGKVVKKLKDMFQADYGITSLKELPADKVDECKIKFDFILSEVK